MEDMQPGQIISPTSPGGEQPVADSPRPMQESTSFSPVASTPSLYPMPIAPPPAPESDTVATVPSPSPVDSPAIAPPEVSMPSGQMPIISAPLPPADRPVTQSQPEKFNWSAAEYVSHERHGMWYGLYILGTALLAAVVYFTTKDILSTAIVFVAILGLVLFASRKPSVQEYTIDGDVLRVGNKDYYLHDFKAFSVIEESQVAELILRPLKRFLPMVSVYVSPDQVDALADYLADFLSFEPHKPDAVDNLLRRIRF